MTNMNKSKKLFFCTFLPRCTSHTYLEHKKTLKILPLTICVITFFSSKDWDFIMRHFLFPKKTPNMNSLFLWLHEGWLLWLTIAHQTKKVDLHHLYGQIHVIYGKDIFRKLMFDFFFQSHFDNMKGLIITFWPMSWRILFYQTKR